MFKRQERQITGDNITSYELQSHVIEELVKSTVHITRHEI